MPICGQNTAPSRVAVALDAAGAVTLPSATAFETRSDVQGSLSSEQTQLLAGTLGAAFLLDDYLPLNLEPTAAVEAQARISRLALLVETARGPPRRVA
jgi:hypothetical protein